MTEQTQNLLRQARKLPLAERAEVAVELIASLDGDPEPDAETAWATEVERRARRALTGESSGTDWETVRGRVARRLDQT